MRNRSFLTWVALVVILLGGNASALAQYEGWLQSQACPGWNNPNNFSSYSGRGGWVGINKEAPNVLTGNTAINWMSGLYSGQQLGTVAATSCYSYSGFDIPNHDRQYVIMTTASQASGHPVNRDPYTQDRLPFVPTQFNTHDTTGLTINTNITRSIRIGDDCSSGSGSGTNYLGANALYYDMYVTTDNAMLFLYYAVVVESPGHGIACDPTFIIRVTKKNASNNWVQISDTMAYMVPSTPVSSGGIVSFAPSYDVNGWHQANSINYKDWVKVVINLSQYLYQNVRIEVMISDCCYNAHFGYAYVAGECRPMGLLASGCPGGMSTDVTTLSAPRGLQNYVWYASEYGVANPLATLNPGGRNDYFTFRQLTPDVGREADGAYLYRVQADDFRVVRRRSNDVTETIDSVGQRQTFRCLMTSAIDPAKPFTSHLDVNVQNKKPTMAIDSLSLCTGDVKLWNRSQVPGDPTLVVRDSTQWLFYDNPNCDGTPMGEVLGDSVLYHFDDNTLKGVRVRTFTCLEDCYSEAVYPIRPRQLPEVRLDVSRHVLCDAEETTLTDNSSDAYYRRWSFRAENAPRDDMSLTDVREGWGDDLRSVTRPFNHSVEPVELMVRNGQYYLNRENTEDTVWCAMVVRDTISVFVHPELQVVGDVMVCQGGSTDAMVHAVGVDDCTYEWSRTLGTITGSIPSGPHLAVVPYADTSTYFVRVTSPQGCVAWDSIHVFLVRPQLHIEPADGRICPGDEAVLIGSAADHYTWSASPNDPSLAGQSDQERIVVSPQVTTTYTLVGHGSNNCDATPLKTQVTIVPLPVSRVIIDPEYIDTDAPTVTLTDASQYSVSSSWRFPDGSTEDGRTVTHNFVEGLGSDSITMRLVSYNELGCAMPYEFGIPVNLYTAWFPNVFTPDSRDENSYFRLFTINDYEYFHIYIYDRRGQMVFESDDVNFRWDGTCRFGRCPQDSYVYVCRYLKPGTTTLTSLKGSVTLLR